MVHDFQQNDCLDQGRVMTPKRGIGLQLYEWSNCSATELRAYRIAGGTKCLMDMDPANDLIKPACFHQEFDLTYQCKAMFGENAVVCTRLNSVSSACHFLQCESMHMHSQCIYTVDVEVIIVLMGKNHAQHHSNNLL